jgi:hypothetical protein
MLVQLEGYCNNNIEVDLIFDAFADKGYSVMDYCNPSDESNTIKLLLAHKDRDIDPNDVLDDLYGDILIFGNKLNKFINFTETGLMYREYNKK